MIDSNFHWPDSRDGSIAQDCDVEVFHKENYSAPFQHMRFPASRIVAVKENGKFFSAIEREGGIFIPVRLTYAELCKRLVNPEGGLIDLTQVTGDLVAPQAAPAYELGQQIEGKGIYVGTQIITDPGGLSLGEFNVFASPERAKAKGKILCTSFNEAVGEVASRDNWWGHPGLFIDTEFKLQSVIRYNTYHGEWFLPTKKILLENIYPNMKYLAEIFEQGWTWSCSDAGDGKKYNVDLASGKVESDPVARPIKYDVVRLEPLRP